MTGATTPDTSRPEAVASAAQAADPDELPFVAPCRRLPVRAPLDWLRVAWRDFCAAPRQAHSAT